MNTITQFVPERKAIAPEKIRRENFSYSLSLFDEKVLAFFKDLSAELIRSTEFRQNPEIVSLSFWLRRANLEEIRTANQHLFSTPLVHPSPIGLVFHVCPANVDTMFVYSICISLLAGNRNIIRISSDINSETDHLLRSLNETLRKKEHSSLRSYITIVNYPHDEEINQYFSQLADARVLWGGDRTVELFKKLKTQPRCKDIVFPNRLSYSLLDMKAFTGMEKESQKKWMKNFYNDTYIFNQKGCSSPQLLFFLNSNEEKEKAFYHALLSCTEEQYKVDAYSLTSLKYNTLIGDIITGKTEQALVENNLVYFVELEKDHALPENCGGGYFYYRRIESLEDILPFIDSSSQTLTYLGLSNEQLSELNSLLHGKGIDRIVEAGNALKFNNYWDGYNLLDELTRKRYIETPH